MNALPDKAKLEPLSWSKAAGFGLVAVLSFTLAYGFSALSFLIVVYLYCLLELTRLGTSRRAFYGGFTVGMLACSFQLTCFYTIFGPAALALWAILAFWLGLFVMLARLGRVNFRPVPATLLIPFLWMGLEYFRSELYYLRFSWLNVGYVFAGHLPIPHIQYLGMYGLGFALVAVVAGLRLLRPLAAAASVLIAALVVGLLFGLKASSPDDQPAGRIPKRLSVAGVQLEFPIESEIIAALDKLLASHSQAELLVLSEYTLDGLPPEKLKAWCRDHQRYLVVGGKDPTPDDFYDTAFVIGPTGEIIFRQAKVVPVQFLKDGLPATEQRLWESPWGRIGFCICYDLSYTRVIDRLIRLGAETIINPTMDVADWGQREHELHARVAPIRTAEHGIPIFRVASSGISQLVDSRGRVTASAPFPGQGEPIAGTLELRGPGSLPFDRVVAPISVGVTALAIAWLTLISLRRKFSKHGQPQQSEGAARPVREVEPV